ncbi:MAG: hypothetical protein OXB94_09790 [Nitrospira sp.]|nr:hypothetical protein [Nitrospira sp.]
MADDLMQQEEFQHLEAQRQHWLKQLYQNQEPIVYGPAMSPVVREGC